MHGRQEHTDMLFGDVALKATSEGKQYLEYCERETKTRKGDSGNIRSFVPKMFERPGDPRCPIATFKEFIKRRPAKTLTQESRMYLSVLHNIVPDSTEPPIRSVWYNSQPLGKNKLGDIAKPMSLKAGLAGRKVNHSARKTTVTSLLHSKTEATQIMQLTGHRNVQSINQYSSASMEQQETMSSILSDISSGNRGTFSNLDVNSSYSLQPSTSKPVKPVVTEAQITSDDELANIDFDAVVTEIQNYEQFNNISVTDNSVKPTVIDLAPVMPNSRICLFPYANLSGNVTVNLYGVNEK